MVQEECYLWCIRRVKSGARGRLTVMHEKGLIALHEEG